MLQSTHDGTLSAPASLPATTATPSAIPSIAPSDSGLEALFSQHVLRNPALVQVANALDIDPALTHRTDSSLQLWYKKYTAFHEAVGELNRMKTSNQWTLPD